MLSNYIDLSSDIDIIILFISKTWCLIWIFHWSASQEYHCCPDRQQGCNNPFWKWWFCFLFVDWLLSLSYIIPILFLAEATAPISVKVHKKFDSDLYDLNSDASKNLTDKLQPPVSTAFVNATTRPLVLLSKILIAFSFF